MKDSNANFGSGELSPDCLERANINPSTGLATDYLNHFNEVVMMLEMLPDIPECVEDVMDWRPADYVSHFENSVFSEKALAILAFQHAPDVHRAALEEVTATIDQEVIALQGMLQDGGTSDAEFLQFVQFKATDTIRPLISRAGGIIHGQLSEAYAAEQDVTQADVDALFS